MSRYVDIDKHVYVRYIDERWNEIVTSLHTIAEILQYTVGLFPIEDTVVEVVRCKDCKFFENENPCGIVDWWNSPDDFCSKGERRE